MTQYVERSFLVIEADGLSLRLSRERALNIYYQLEQFLTEEQERQRTAQIAELDRIKAEQDALAIEMAERAEVLAARRNERKASERLLGALRTLAEERELSISRTRNLVWWGKQLRQRAAANSTL